VRDRGVAYNPLGNELKPGDVLLYIDSDDIEVDLKKAVKLGGTLVREKTEIPGFGWFGVFKDPTGNPIAVYTSMDPNNNK
jgi:predicted enzyme related to lactoylglutathione lyase